MNKLSVEKRAQVIRTLVEGNSIRATCRITGAAKGTVTRLFVSAGAAKGTVTRLFVSVGTACAKYQDIHLRNLPSKAIQCDELWSFCYAKQKNVPVEKQGRFGYGDVWTWIAIDVDTKLVPSWLVGLRDAGYAFEFLKDLRGRLANRVQLTTDGHKTYFNAVEDVFGADIDYAMLIKLYGQEPESEKRYSPAKCIGTNHRTVTGHPNPKLISTSFVERQNLTMRMSMRRFTRLTNAFSKKVENLEHTVALHFMYYNFARPHKALANPYPRTPAMTAGISDHIWDIEEILVLLDDYLEE